MMKKGSILVLGLAILLSFNTLRAQLLIGPGIAGGMTYAKNLVVDDTSRFFINNSPSLFASGGLDILYQFDDNIRAHIGGAFMFRQYSLQAPDDREGLSFSTIDRTALAVGIPTTIHYRIPLKEEGSTYFNIIAGHNLEITFGDSTVNKTPSTAIDSGGAWVRHEYKNIKDIIPSVLLGAGLDFQSESGNILNVTLLWGIGVGRIFEGNVQEWEVLNQNFNPEEQELPEEFPEHYFDWALRGSYLSLRLSYWFDVGKLFSGGDDEDE